jgi:hypothetical protein
MSHSDGDSESDEKSFGNIGPKHWTRARAGENAEAMDYYRERSKAPGVASGGGPRNFYCMRCDGVIPHDHGGASCPHCGEPLDENAKRYFNRVEINEPAKSDFMALLPTLIGAAVVLLVVGLLALWFFL